MNKPVENGARAKGGERILKVSDYVIERYNDSALERNQLMGNSDRSTHVFINLYATDKSKGKAMSYHRTHEIIKRWSKRIGFDLTGAQMLRHTLATRLLRGIDSEQQPSDVVQSILSHASINSSRVYSHGSEEAKRVALKSVAIRTVAIGAIEWDDILISSP